MAEVYSSTVGDSSPSSPSSDDSSCSNMSVDLSKDLLAELINEGAFLLENGQHSAAISVLTSALDVAMRDAGCPEFMLCNNQQQGDGEEDRCGGDDACDEESSVVSRGSCHHSQRRNKNGKNTESKHSPRQKRTKQRRYLAQTSMARCNQQPIVTQDKLPVKKRTNYIHGKPLRVADRYSLPCFVELTLYVVYNLALAYQLRVLSKRRRKGNTKTLLEIVRLYKLAQAIQWREEIGLEPTNTVSLWNNLGHAYKSLGHDNQADICFNNLLSNVVCMIDHGCAHEVDHLDDFLDNIGHILTPDSHYADAA